jgi:cytochrome c-type biogenesis protein CcmH
MNSFLLIAALMAALAAMTVALPLMRHKRSRWIGSITAVLIVGVAAALYPLWSNWNWHAPAQSQAAPDVLAMVAKLEKHLHGQPDDVTGWLMLGRSDLALERLDDAVMAYDRAHRLDANNADAALGLGEALSLRAGGEIPPAAAALFEQALLLAPGNPKALLYGGFAAATRGDRALARSRWQALKALQPPPQIMQMLDARIAALGPIEGTASDAVPAAASAGTNTSTVGTGTSAEGSAAPQVTVNISIAPGLKSKLKSEAPLFVFAREPAGQGPPLAAKRLTTAAIGTQVKLSPADSMLPGRVLVSGRRVSVTARVSFGGQPIPAAGDLFGEVSYEVGRDTEANLVIDHVVE